MAVGCLALCVQLCLQALHRGRLLWCSATVGRLLCAIGRLLLPCCCLCAVNISCWLCLVGCVVPLGSKRRRRCKELLQRLQSYACLGARAMRACQRLHDRMHV